MGRSGIKRIILTGLLVLLLLLGCMPVLADQSTYQFRVSKTVESSSASEKESEFTFTGKIQTGTLRPAAPGDYWYGTADTVYEGKQTYYSSFTYVKTNSEDGTVLETGTITPNGVGWFSFRLKDHETITFSVNNIGTMWFYLYETPDDRFTTKAICNGAEFTGTVNVKTGAVVGIGAIPGGMETRYIESGETGAGSEYGPKLYSLTQDMTIRYVNTSVANPPVYNVSYEFVSNTAGKTLPAEVTNLLPNVMEEVPDKTAVTPQLPAETKVTVVGGTWSFDGYDPESADVNGADLVFQGGWSFTEDPPKVYNVTYSFLSGTAGKTLPKEVTDLLPETQTQVAEGTTVTPSQPSSVKVSVSGGTWSFDGYDPEKAEVNGADLSFTGTWSYQEDETAAAPSKPQPAQPTPPASPSSPVSAPSQSTPVQTPVREEAEHYKFTELFVRAESLLAEKTAAEESPEVHEKTEPETAPVSPQEGIEEESVPESKSVQNEGTIDIRFIWRIAGLVVMNSCAVFLFVNIVSKARVLKWYARKKKEYTERK